MSQNYAHNAENATSSIMALQWYLDNGVDELLADAPVDRTVMPELPKASGQVIAGPQDSPAITPTNIKTFERPKLASLQDSAGAQEMMGAAQAVVQAQKIAATCQTLLELEGAIKEFEGLSIRKNASNIVFSDGAADAPIMVIGEAPNGDDDIAGKPFMGPTGALQDKILASIGLGRMAGTQSKSETYKGVYFSNILNWRPPGNRTPTSAEIDISLPFIERHIALVKPRALIFCGGLVGKALLRRSEPISKLRGTFHDYQVPEVLGGVEGETIPAIVTYHPEYLLKTPTQKKAVWADMLMFRDKLADLLS